jgi:hypothetical protein
MFKKLLLLFTSLPLITLSQKNDTIWLTKGARVSEVITFEKGVCPSAYMYYCKTDVDPHLRFTNQPLFPEYEVTTEPLIVERKQTGSLPLTIEYYYTPDSIVRAAIYYWKRRYENESQRKKACLQEHKKSPIYKEAFLANLSKFSFDFEIQKKKLEKFPLDTWWYQMLPPNLDYVISLNSKFRKTDHEVTAWIYWK